MAVLRPHQCHKPFTKYRNNCNRRKKSGITYVLCHPLFPHHKWSDSLSSLTFLIRMFMLPCFTPPTKTSNSHLCRIWWNQSLASPAQPCRLQYPLSSWISKGTSRFVFKLDRQFYFQLVRPASQRHLQNVSPSSHQSQSVMLAAARAPKLDLGWRSLFW